MNTTAVSIKSCLYAYDCRTAHLVLNDQLEDSFLGKTYSPSVSNLYFLEVLYLGCGIP